MLIYVAGKVSSTPNRGLPKKKKNLACRTQAPVFWKHSMSGQLSYEISFVLLL